MKNNEQLLLRVREGDQNAKEELVNNNLGLVHHIVKRFLGRGVEEEDLFQIGSIGLLKAIDRFELSYEVKFSTYAVPMIQGEIKRFLRDDGMIKVSRSIKENSIRINKVVSDYVKSKGYEPTVEIICEKTGLTNEEILMAMESHTEVESIYQTVGWADEKPQFLVDRISADAKEDENIVNRVLLLQLLDTLSGEDRELLMLRYFEDKTQMQVAEKMGISQVKVSRMEKKILMGLRKIARP